MYEDEDHICSGEFCALQREAALEDFDLNMAYFRQLSGKGFLEARPVTDLTVFDDVEGICVVVPDRYWRYSTLT